MCAQFTLKIKANELSKKFGIAIHEPLPEDYDIRVRGFIKTDKAPVVFFDSSNELQIREMNYSLCPSWSQEFPYPWSTYNARMERHKISKDKKTQLNPKTNQPVIEYIYQVPTWRDSFNQGKTCLVPMNAAIESSYFGTHAGQILQFSTTSKSTFYVVGLWSDWVHPETGEIQYSFALITDDPYEFFYKSGHDRSIFVIGEKDYDKWLKDRKMTPQERFKFLRDHRNTLDWAADTERPMKKGWEKRAPNEKELSEIHIWKKA